MKVHLQVISLVFLFSIVQAQAQSVGLVLSGGGAKGLAHISVIRELEENGIPIDYIAGTSIGAIIGGLYASGYTPDEMEQLFKSEDFYFWSTGKIQKEYRYYFKQPELDPSWLELRVAKKEEKLKLLPPTSLIPDEQMDFAFMELVASTNAASTYNFDSLMVPFFCVATDVNNNAPAILRRGDLGSAIRASMTVPFYFRPIEIDGRLLLDGGIVNNFPHDVMKETFNPDIIIGHKVAADQKIAKADDLVTQIENLVMRPTNFEIDPENGILLESKLTNVGLLDFQKIDMIQDTGRNTIVSALDSIKGLIKRRVSPESIAAKRNIFNARKPELYFRNIDVQGVTDPMQRNYIIRSLKHGKDVVTLDELKKEYFKLIADEHIKSMLPTATYNPETGYFDLQIKVEPEKKFKVNFGGNISTKPINQGFASFDYRTYLSRAYTISSNIYFGRFYSSFKIGGKIYYPTRHPFYLAGYSTFNRWDFFSTSSELFFEDVRPPYIIQNENNHRVELGFPLGLHRKFYFGTTYAHSSDDYYQTDIFKKTDTPDKTTFSAFVATAGLENNSLNYKQFATEGSFRCISGRYITGIEKHSPGSTSADYITSRFNHSYLMLKANILDYFKINRKITLGTLAEGVISNKPMFTNYRSTLLNAPGFFPTPHSKTLFLEKFRANNYIAGGLQSIFHFNSSLNLRLEGYAFLPIHELSRNEDQIPTRSKKAIENYYLQGAATLVYQTGIGPISLMLNYYEKQNSNLFVSLNFGYVIFNKRGF